MKKETWEEIMYIVHAETKSASEMLEIAKEIVRAIREEVEKEEPWATTEILNLEIIERELWLVSHECSEAEYNYE